MCDAVDGPDSVHGQDVSQEERDEHRTGDCFIPLVDRKEGWENHAEDHRQLSVVPGKQGN